MTTTGPEDHSHRDEATLAPFFAAARRDEPAPPHHLISAILADAGEVSATRAAAARSPAVAPRAAARRRRGGFLAAVGGWRVATALAAASVFGFWVGLSGAIDVGGRVGWTTATVETVETGDPVTEFFDLASAE